MKKKDISILTIMATATVVSCASKPKQETKRPNIIVILADDMGFSDLGCYGGEVQTPNLNNLAMNGIRFTQFYNCSRSCPTRASLLTGLYQHQAGVGRMTFDQQEPGYKGTLSKQAVTIAEILDNYGYQTGMVGKWHVAETPLRDDQEKWLSHQVYHETFAPIENYPVNRGFQDYYGDIYGVVDYFDPFSLVNGTTPIKKVPKDYYSTVAFSDSAISYVNRYAKNEEPFFLYLAYHCPHWPLHALPQDIEKYKDTYKCGWKKIRDARYERQKEMKLFGDKNNFLSKRAFDDDWSNDKDTIFDACAMAVHAAMIDRMDQGIGRLVASLKKNGQLDNTLIMFLSDNGCSPEVCQKFSPGENDRPDMTRDGRKVIYPKNKEALPGPETVMASVGDHWANVANTPFRYWKAKTYEGGICTPFIAHWPDGINLPKGLITTQSGHVIDIMATCLDLAKAKYPKTYQGNKIIPLEGKSLIPIFQKGERTPHKFIAFEHINERALITKDNWKIIRPRGEDTKWELYNLNEDRTEMHDLATEYPSRLKKLIKIYNNWEQNHMVIPRPIENKK